MFRMELYKSFLCLIALLCVINWSCDATAARRSETLVSDPLWPGYLDPQLVHIAYGSTEEQMSVTWSTVLDTNESVVLHGPDLLNLNLVGNGSSSLFTDPGKEKRKQYLHRVTLTGLKSGQKYYYRCGSRMTDKGPKMSELYSFNAMQHGSDWSPRFAIYGDFGTTNPQSLEALMKETYLGHFDAILHDGDIAYQMTSDQGRNGDRFLRNIQPIAANLPYMVTVGNHERFYNYTNYKNMFSMPGGTQGMFYSYNVGPVHIVSISTEFYYYYKKTDAQISEQYRWLEADLKAANLAENRQKRPWIILLGHRPLYCAAEFVPWTTIDCGRFRTGKFGLEKLLHDYGVDMAIWAHEHTYKRFWPMYKFKLHMGDFIHPYHNPTAVVQIVTGSAGCGERLSPQKVLPYWVARLSKDYGYTRMTIHNSTHLYFEQVSDDKYGAVVDTTWLVQEKHGPFRP